MARLNATERHKSILSAVSAAHRKWRKGVDVSRQTRLSVEINNDWQARALSVDKAIRAEVELPGVHKQRIDLVDIAAHSAYELKVSPNNVHMEFYRDIFKVLIFNQLSDPKQRVNKLYFLAPRAGLQGMGPMKDQAIAIAKQFGKLRVECIAVDD